MYKFDQYPQSSDLILLSSKLNKLKEELAYLLHKNTFSKLIFNYL